MPRVRRSPEPVIRMVAQGRHHAQIIADLHARAVSAGAASRSVLLEVDADRRHLRPTSGTGFDNPPPEAWIELPDSVALAYEVMASGDPRQIAPLATVLPDLAFRLGTPAAIVAPVVAQGQALGLLVLAVAGVVPAPEWSDQVAACADAFALALSRWRLERELALQHGIDGLILDLARTGGGERNDTHLERFCVGLSRLMGADRVTEWRHDRVARRLVVAAASDGSHRRRPASAPTADTDALLVKALRGTQAELMDVIPETGRPAATNAAVPLLGQRRALGVLVLQGLRLQPGDAPRLRERLNRLGQQLSRVIEGRQLLDDVLRARRELEHAFDAMRDIVMVCDRQRRLVRINDAGAARCRRERTEMIGCPVAEVVGEAFGQWLGDLPLGAPDHWHPSTTEIEDAVLDGTFVISATPLPDDEGALAGLVIVAREVTDERRFDAERSTLRERLAQSAALSHLVAGIAHELNNPLQGVLGHIELLRRTTRVPAAIDRPLRQIHREADRAGRIVRNLLLLAGSGRLALRAISANTALSKALGRRAAACRRLGINVRRKLGTGLPRIQGDALLLQQAFLNILTNAEQALAQTPGGRIDVRSLVRGGRIVVEIRDNGPGLPPEVAPRVFETFFTTRESGSGLGLALTLRIVREHGGEATAGNAPDGGAVFTVSLPTTLVVK